MERVHRDEDASRLGCMQPRCGPQSSLTTCRSKKIDKYRYLYGKTNVMRKQGEQGCGCTSNAHSHRSSSLDHLMQIQFRHRNQMAGYAENMPSTAKVSNSESQNAPKRVCMQGSLRVNTNAAKKAKVSEGGAHHSQKPWDAKAAIPMPQASRYRRRCGL